MRHPVRPPFLPQLVKELYISAHRLCETHTHTHTVRQNNTVLCTFTVSFATNAVHSVLQQSIQMRDFDQQKVSSELCAKTDLRK